MSSIEPILTDLISLLGPHAPPRKPRAPTIIPSHLHFGENKWDKRILNALSGGSRFVLVTDEYLFSFKELLDQTGWEGCDRCYLWMKIQKSDATRREGDKRMCRECWDDTW